MTEKRLRGLPAFVFSLAAAYLVMGLRVPRAAEPSKSMDVAGFNRLPVLNGGRIKPLDTVARTSLLLLRGKQTVRLQGRTLGAGEWLLDMLYKPKEADANPVFEIDDPDVLGIMGFEQTTNRYYSFNDLHPHLKEIENQARQADGVKSGERTRYQAAVSNLFNRLLLYSNLQDPLRVAGAEFYPLPLEDRWISVGEAIFHHMDAESLRPGVIAWASMGNAWRTSDASAFRRALTEYKTWVETQAPSQAARARAEFVFNRFEPFYKSMVLYVAVFLLAFLSFLFWPQTLIRSAFRLLNLAFAVHTTGLITRMILQGRPPVTNLYSSAIFVGWAAVLLGIILERLYKNGIGSMVAGVIGFATLIIAHHLAAQGDTLEMMRAVLDSNFWLATHVVCITIGYSATFLSGFLAALCIFRRRFDSRWSEAKASELERMVYGVVCFSLLFSFVGTILGGIWADQSWGRFWGWDPKENGALMIVLWNAFILHARLGNLVKPKDVIVMAVFGNIVTACSWFGVNMLGIGLHSYGWMDKAFTWLALFIASQLAIIVLGLVRPSKHR